MILSLFSLQHFLSVKKISFVQAMMSACILILLNVPTTIVNVSYHTTDSKSTGSKILHKCSQWMNELFH